MKQPSDQSWRWEQWAALDGGVEGVGGCTGVLLRCLLNPAVLLRLRFEPLSSDIKPGWVNAPTLYFLQYKTLILSKQSRSYRYRLCPWSRTCSNISGREGPDAATWRRGWEKTTPTRRCWPGGTGSPGQWLLSAPSQSQSERWTATVQVPKIYNSQSLHHHIRLKDNTVRSPS